MTFVSSPTGCHLWEMVILGHGGLPSGRHRERLGAPVDDGSTIDNPRMKSGLECLPRLRLCITSSLGGLTAGEVSGVWVNTTAKGRPGRRHSLGGRRRISSPEADHNDARIKRWSGKRGLCV